MTRPRGTAPFMVNAAMFAVALFEVKGGGVEPGLSVPAVKCTTVGASGPPHDSSIFREGTLLEGDLPEGNLVPDPAFGRSPSDPKKVVFCDLLAGAVLRERGDHREPGADQDANQPAPTDSTQPQQASTDQGQPHSGGVMGQSARGWWWVAAPWVRARVAAVAACEVVACHRPSSTSQPPPRVLDICAGDDAASKLEDWPTGTEVHDPSVMARFEGLVIVEEGARTTGGLPRETVERYLHGNLAGFRGCYAQAFKDGVMETVEMTVHLTVDLRGEVSDVRVQSDKAQAAFESCLTVGLHEYLKFPQPTGARVDVTYSLRFVPPVKLASYSAPRRLQGSPRWASRVPQTDPLRFDDSGCRPPRSCRCQIGTVTAPVTLDGVEPDPNRRRDAVRPLARRAGPREQRRSRVNALPHGDAWLLVADGGPGDDVTVAGPADAGGGSFHETAPVGTPFVARVGATGMLRCGPDRSRANESLGSPWPRTAAIAFARILSRSQRAPGNCNCGAVVGGWRVHLAEDARRSRPRGELPAWPALVRGVAVDGAGAVVVAGSVEPWGPNARSS